MSESCRNLKYCHETFLYPVVRVFSKAAAGSGTIIYCEEDPKEPGEFLTFVLTNHHVIDDLVTYKKEWDSVLKREIPKEFHEKAKVEVFSYVRMSEVDSSNRYIADIVAYDKNHDLAILKIDSPRKFEPVAKLISKEDIRNLKLFMDVVVSGCSLAHEPFCNFGQITFLKEIIEQKKYIMTNAASIFGNSGGALFSYDTGELIGVPSRISGIQLGFGHDIITWMGFSAHPERLYEFLEEQELHFLVGKEDDNYHTAMERRKKKAKRSLVERYVEENAGETVRINKSL